MTNQLMSRQEERDSAYSLHKEPKVKKKLISAKKHSQTVNSVRKGEMDVSQRGGENETVYQLSNQQKILQSELLQGLAQIGTNFGKRDFVFQRPVKQPKEEVNDSVSVITN